ncbi:Flp family type IVb pilin [Tessaracoccus sp. Y36]
MLQLLPVLQYRIARLTKSEKGATAVEYGIMVAAIAAVIVAVVFLLGKEILAAFNTVLAQF